MTRRLEAGPLLATLGAVLLLVSLFLPWFTGEVSAWQAFEVWDLVLFVLALAAIAAGVGLLDELVERRFLVVAVAAVVAIVASQIIDPPPAASGQDPDTGAWLALGAAFLMLAGAALTVSRVHLALTFEGRDQRRHVPAVDARGPKDPTTEHDAVAPGGERLFARGDKQGATAATAPIETNESEGKAPPGQKQD